MHFMSGNISLYCTHTHCSLVVWSNQSFSITLCLLYLICSFVHLKQASKALHEQKSLIHSQCLQVLGNKFLHKWPGYASGIEPSTHVTPKRSIEASSSGIFDFVKYIHVKVFNCKFVVTVFTKQQLLFGIINSIPVDDINVHASLRNIWLTTIINDMLNSKEIRLCYVSHYRITFTFNVTIDDLNANLIVSNNSCAEKSDFNTLAWYGIYLYIFTVNKYLLYKRI